MILITTSHRPSQRTRSFVKDLASVLPSSTVLARGKKPFHYITEYAREYGFKHILIVYEMKGNPARITIYSIENTSGREATMMGQIVLKGVKLSRERGSGRSSLNASSVKIEWKGCRTDKCFMLADLLLSMLSYYLSPRPSLTIRLKDEDDTIIVSFTARGNRRVGPVLKVREVRTYVGKI